MEAEIKLLQLLVRTCQAVRSPHNPKNRVEMAVPAAQYEMQFNQRLEKLKADKAKGRIDAGGGQ
jgi:hypothetical protein